MNLDHLRYFLITAKIQHIGKAAAQLHVSPSAISHSLRKLESKLGNPLFRKTGKNIHLTDIGRQFASRSTALVDSFDGLLHEFRSSELPLSGTIKIAASHGLSNHLVTKAMSALQAQHPSIVFEAYSLRSAEVVDHVARNLVDAGICFSPTAHPSVTVLSSSQQRLAICVRKDHSVRRLRGAKLFKQLSQLPCASPKAFSGVEICEDHPSLRVLRIQSNIALAFDSYDVAAGYLNTTNAWCLMPEGMARIHDLALLQIPKLHAQASISVLVPKGRSLPLAIAEALTSVL